MHIKSYGHIIRALLLAQALLASRSKPFSCTQPGHVILRVMEANAAKQNGLTRESGTWWCAMKMMKMMLYSLSQNKNERFSIRRQKKTANSPLGVRRCRYEILCFDIYVYVTN